MRGGRPISRTGDAPRPPEPPKRVELGRRLRGMYIQAHDGPIEISWDGRAWLVLDPGAAKFYLVAEPFVWVRAAGAPARYTVVGVLV